MSEKSTEVRLNADGTLDEVVGVGRFHLEQMSDSHWWLELNGVHVNLGTLRRAHIKAHWSDERRGDDPKPVVKGGA